MISRLKTALMRLACLMIALVPLSCATSIPAGLTAVSPFDAQRYMGTWYEIARLDHRFERGMTHVTATYRLLPNGKVEVINRAIKNGQAKSITGTAKRIGDGTAASLAVTFFPPFAGGYHVIWIDTDYQNAVVSGPNRKYLWLLSRNTNPPVATYDDMVAFAQSKGFDTSRLIRVDHAPE
jgi:apolipoprotein D and lipocalin family protein